MFSQYAYNKSFKLFSLENKEDSVNINLDPLNEKITLKLTPDEVLCVHGYRGLEQQINILNQKFVELFFRIRGGSGVAVRRYILICISNNKLYKSIDVLSTVSSEFNLTYVPSIDSLNLYDEKSLYNLSFMMSYQDGQNNKLIATQYEKVTSKYDPTQNHETLDTLQFNFDSKNKIFYNHIESLDGSFTINSDVNNIDIQNNFNGENYSVVKLKDEEYFFIEHSWYVKGINNHLYKLSCECD
jgi:hypothetical protein